MANRKSRAFVVAGSLILAAAGSSPARAFTADDLILECAFGRCSPRLESMVDRTRSACVTVAIANGLAGEDALASVHDCLRTYLGGITVRGAPAEETVITPEGTVTILRGGR